MQQKEEAAAEEETAAEEEEAAADEEETAEKEEPAEAQEQPVPEVDFEDDVPEVDFEDEVAPPDIPGEPQFLGSTLRLTQATGQSYIQGSTVVGGKRKLVVSLSAKQHTDHQKIMADLFGQLNLCKIVRKSKALSLQATALKQ